MVCQWFVSILAYLQAVQHWRSSESMPQLNSLSFRIGKVNRQFDRLAGIMAADADVYQQAKQFLYECGFDQSSLDFQEFDIDGNSITTSKAHSRSNYQTGNIRDHSHWPNAMSQVEVSKIQICSSTLSNADDDDSADATVKKFQATDTRKFKKKGAHPSKHHKNQKDLNKKGEKKQLNGSKLRSVKSGDKLSHYVRTVVLQHKPQLRKAKKKVESKLVVESHGQSRNNCRLATETNLRQHSQEQVKTQIKLKRQANVKISNLNIQRQLCQRQSEYLKASIKISHERLLQIIDGFELGTEQSLLKLFTMKTLVKFFSQFFAERPLTQQISTEQLIQVLVQKNYFLQYTLKLPNILNKHPSLCQQKYWQFLEEKHFIERKLSNLKHLSKDPIFVFLEALYDYISFLLNNNMAHETTRKSLPIEIHSERSKKTRLISKLVFERKENCRGKEYDSERKETGQNRNELKRTGTSKVLCPNRKRNNHDRK